jgi:hypothetical protein
LSKANSPRLVAFGATVPRTAADLDSIAAADAGLPIDGLVFSPGLENAWSATPLDASALEPLFARAAQPPFSEQKGHLLSARVQPGDVDVDDALGMAVVRDNFATLGRVARRLGARGVLLDTQTYSAQRFSYAATGQGRTFEVLALAVRAQGKALTQALLGEFPDAVVVVTIGYLDVWRAVCLDGTPLAQERYGLLPAFLDGVREALGPARQAQLVDGFLPSYSVAQPEAFPMFAAAMDFDAAALDTKSVSGVKSYRYPAAPGDADQFLWPSPPTLRCTDSERAALERPLRRGFAVMVDFGSGPGAFSTSAPQFPGNFHTPQNFEAVLRAALGSAQDTVWLWSSEVDWWQRPQTGTALPAAYRDALVRARAP